MQRAWRCPVWTLFFFSKARWNSSALSSLVPMVFTASMTWTSSAANNLQWKDTSGSNSTWCALRSYCTWRWSDASLYAFGDPDHRQIFSTTFPYLWVHLRHLPSRVTTTGIVEPSLGSTARAITSWEGHVCSHPSRIVYEFVNLSKGKKKWLQFGIQYVRKK